MRKVNRTRNIAVTTRMNDKEYANLKSRVAESGLTQQAYIINAICKKGKWVKTTDGQYYYYVCSVCREKVPKNEWKQDYFSPYCPECGTKMTTEGE